MTIQTAPLYGYHAVERWSADTHYCSLCNVLTVQVKAFRAVICPHFLGVSDQQLLRAACHVAAVHGVHPHAIDECCGTHWRQAEAVGGVCPHNRALSLREKGKVACGP